MTIHRDDGKLEEVLEGMDGRNVVREGVRDIIVDGNHRLVVIGELHKDSAEQYNWKRGNGEVFITMHVYGTEVSSIDIINKNKPVNNVSSKELPCVSFLDLLRAVIEYGRTFHECYRVPFRKERPTDIRREMMSAKIIPGVQDHT